MALCKMCKRHFLFQNITPSTRKRKREGERDRQRERARQHNLKFVSIAKAIRRCRTTPIEFTAEYFDYIIRLSFNCPLSLYCRQTGHEHTYIHKLHIHNNTIHTINLWRIIEIIVSQKIKYLPRNWQTREKLFLSLFSSVALFYLSSILCATMWLWSNDFKRSEHMLDSSTKPENIKCNRSVFVLLSQFFVFCFFDV